MIPKIIHYCWFGGGEKSAFIKKCIRTWEKYLPEFEIKCWSEENFDINTNEFVKQAYIQKKWAFVTDYARFYALYKDGGIYMDTDVRILKPLKKDWLTYDFFSSIEFLPQMYESHKYLLDSSFKPINKEKRMHGLGILSAFMAAIPNHKFVEDCLEMYNAIKPEKVNDEVDFNNFVIGSYITKCAEKYGFIYKDSEQLLKENMLILPKNVLAGNELFIDKDSYLIHLCNGSWTDNRTVFESLLYNLKNKYPAFENVITLIQKVYNKIKR
ncbi:hypothetical protein PK35_02355 [Tamlana nanhaiensis]|uniref:Glycosyl transferase n=1 Tax=Neotamlana nanhaiensis TaxID=1382798 RepID=A0A0D7WA45_9FLAO|nr:glycosyltransferase [Tamlana nanhaiensis]KJD34637.1 hypothetical protein PK35_02355 [Tamlana nanhaiensis]